MKFKELASAALGACCGIAIAWFCCFHLEVTPSGFARLVYENGDWLHRILQIFNIA